MPYRIDYDGAPTEPLGIVGYRITHDGQLIARYWHDHRGDEHGIDFADGTAEAWPIGKVTDVIEGGGPQPLTLTPRAIEYLGRRAQRKAGT